MDALLDIKNVTMRFGSLVANDHVSLSCGYGSVISLLGENGAGKTTLMKVIYGLNKPESGEIYFEGKKSIREVPESGDLSWDPDGSPAFYAGEPSDSGRKHCDGK